MEFVEIINIDTEEKEQRIRTVLKKYCKYPVPTGMILKGNGIKLGFDVTRDLNGDTTNCNLIQATLIHDRSGSIGDYLETVFNLPDETIDKLIEKSRLKKLEPFIMDLCACSEDGGFYWGYSEEGYEFWAKLLFNKLIKTKNTAMCKIDYKKGKLISKEAIEEKKVGYCVRDTKITLDKELLTREQERSNLEDEIKTLKCEYPLSLVNIISCELRLEQLKDEIKLIKDLQIEFGFEKEEKGK